jgi:hypothetical protein
MEEKRKKQKKSAAQTIPEDEKNRGCMIKGVAGFKNERRKLPSCKLTKELMYAHYGTDERRSRLCLDSD